MSSQDAPKVLSTQLEDGICTVTLDRPDALNAMNGALVAQLWDVFRELHGDRGVRVVVLTGAGDRAFCVGADLKERKTMSDDEVNARIRDYRGCFDAIAGLDKPVICAINGFAFGGGLELALACDLRIMAEETKIGLTETRLGIIPGAGGTQRLPRVVGIPKTKELIFGAVRLEADEATKIGLVNRAVPREALIDEATAWAREIARAAPIALEQAKIAIDAGMQTDLATGLDIESRCYAETIPTEDRQEGLRAFAEKRAPEWKGR